MARISGEGLVARFAPIRGITPRGALASKIYLPAMLNTFTSQETALHNEYDTLTAGHFSQPAMGDQNARQFRTATVDAITLAFDPGWLVVTGQDPGTVRTRLREILRFRKPVHLLVTFNPNPLGMGAPLDMYCTFRSIGEDVRPGESESRYLTIDLAEWRDPSVKRRGSTPPGTSSRKRGVKLPTTHKLTATDTLSSLAFEYYGRYDYWRQIRSANAISKKFGQKELLVHLPGHWKVGYKVKIPAIPKAK